MPKGPQGVTSERACKAAADRMRRRWRDPAWSKKMRKVLSDGMRAYWADVRRREALIHELAEGRQALASQDGHDVPTPPTEKRAKRGKGKPRRAQKKTRGDKR